MTQYLWIGITLPESRSTKLWKCPNCGQLHFGDEPPDMCAYCQDFTTWRLVSDQVLRSRRLSQAIKRNPETYPKEPPPASQPLPDQDAD